MIAVTLITGPILLLSALPAAAHDGDYFKSPSANPFESLLEPILSETKVENIRLPEAPGDERVIMIALAAARHKADALARVNEDEVAEARLVREALESRSQLRIEVAAKLAAEEAARKERERLAAEAAAAEAAKKKKEELARLAASYSLPVRDYRISSTFGDYCSCRSGPHTGLDFDADYGDKVRAVHGGKIIFAGWDGNYGNKIIIDHGGGVKTVYAHLSRITNSGTVGTGELIGRVGSTGNSTGAHLHFEVNVGGSLVDPYNWLRQHGLGV